MNNYNTIYSIKMEDKKMIDIEKRTVVFGDGTLKVAFNPFGMLFGNINTPADQYEMNFFMGALDIIDFYKVLSEMEEKEELEHTFNATTMKFVNKESIHQLKQSLLIWGTSLKKSTDIMAAFVNEKLKEEYPDVNAEKILTESETEDAYQSQEE